MHSWPRRTRGAVLAALVIATTLAYSLLQPKPTIRNVLLISVDTLRADHLGTYGYGRNASPNIDALAASSWLYEHAYAPAPSTGPSVAGLLTGMFPTNVEEWSIHGRMETLAETLSAEGWRTVAAVDNANLSRQAGYAQGFDVYRETWEESDQEVARTHLITETALEHLARFADSGEPFFIWLHDVNPHTPYSPPEGFDAMFVGDPYFDDRVRLPRTAGYVGGIWSNVYVEGEHRLAYYVAQYDAEVAFTDQEVGKVLDAVRSHPGRSKDTLIVLSADHGEGLGEHDVYFTHGPYVLESHVRVPLLVRIPAEADRPRRVSKPVSIIDVVPTILDLVGVTRPPFTGDRTAYPLAGQSLVLTREGEIVDHRRDIFFASPNFWGIRSDDWKMILKTRDQEGADLGPSHQLFDVPRDPQELSNLYRADADRTALIARRLDARRQLQAAQFGDPGTDPAERYNGLTPEAIKNLRTLGYVR